jgi:hypothetical protein
MTFSSRLFIPQVHLSVSEMETLMAAPLVIVTLMMMSPSFSIPCLFYGVDSGGVDVGVIVQHGGASDSGATLVLCLSNRLK